MPGNRLIACRRGKKHYFVPTIGNCAAIVALAHLFPSIRVVKLTSRNTHILSFGPFRVRRNIFLARKLTRLVYSIFYRNTALLGNRRSTASSVYNTNKIASHSNGIFLNSDCRLLFSHVDLGMVRVIFSNKNVALAQQ